MQRLADLLPAAAAELGLEEPLARGRAMAAWQHVVAEHVPAAQRQSRLLEVRDDGSVVVTAGSPILAQEIRLRSVELLAAFGRAPGGRRGRELRVVVRRVD